MCSRWARSSWWPPLRHTQPLSLLSGPLWADDVTDSQWESILAEGSLGLSITGFPSLGATGDSRPAALTPQPCPEQGR